MKNVCFCCILIIIFFTNCQSNNYPKVADNFEFDSLSTIWKNDKFVSGALKIQTEIVRNGKKAAMFVLKQGDQIEKEKGSKFERAELKEAKNFTSDENKNYEYAFSLFLPNDFPITPTRLVIAQWKQNCKKDECNPDNPVLALRYSSGVFFITKQSGFKRDTLYIQPKPILNQWLDFKFKVRFSTDDSGRIITILNGDKIIDFRGKTAYPENNGEYQSPNNFYFKMGLYRDLSPETMVIYLDNYRKQEIEKLK